MTFTSILFVAHHGSIRADILDGVNEIPLVEVRRGVITVVDIHEALAAAVIGQHLLRSVSWLNHIRTK